MTTESGRPWQAALHDLVSSSDRLTESSRQLASLFERESLSDVARRSWASLAREIERICGEVSALSDLLEGAMIKLFTGHALTREEYLLLLSTGLDVLAMLGVRALDGFEVLPNLHYVSDDLSGYINVGAPPRPNIPDRIPGRFGIPPERVRVSCLRPEQQIYLDLTWPQVSARFRQD